MQNRRDQVQAHRFVVSRLTSGLLRADPDAPEPSTRRTDRGVAFGAVFAAVLAVGFLVYGLISPGGATGWRDGHTLVVEEGTGARYVFDGARLRPVRNYASARLLVGADLKTDTVSAASLRGTPHGDPVGIEGAPDDLPDAGPPGSGAWEVCAGTRPTDSGERAGTTTLVVDSRLPGDAVADGVLVRDDKGGLFLAWHGTRFRLAAGQAAAAALGYGAADPLPVSAAFLDAVPAGADLAEPRVAGQGGAGPDVDGTATRIGQVFVVRTPGSAQQYYLLLRSGLTPVTTTQAALLLGASSTREKAYGGKAPQALALSPNTLDRMLAPKGSHDEAAGVQRSGSVIPAAPPVLAQSGDDRNLCVRLTPQGDAGTGVALVSVDSSAVAAGATAPGRALVPACLAVDAVSVPASGGALVQALSSTGSSMGDTTYLVTDTGGKYRIASADAATALGYDVKRAQKLPSPLLDMLPTGPDLSPEAARAGRSDAAGGSRCAGGPATS
ncbi:type VII secretion protein EccB [Streptomyces mirabilis]|uniref:Type VII secretion protein EccB n=1 Tax=Streptomyces mirabilis TaxID=68239 RepID=A0ABU3V5D1_9ACTN|nr:type VII secretion protein EccB [Streptomyces mirabilis]MCX5355740.1 type VII secretion protein EccB [Streptomyces mirabilis]MDU9001383.1 type VII secretion protein EccB [Streptomyces mirabilis]